MAGVSPDILTMQHQDKFQLTNIIFKIETLAMGETLTQIIISSNKLNMQFKSFLIIRFINRKLYT